MEPPEPVVRGDSVYTEEEHRDDAKRLNDRCHCLLALLVVLNGIHGVWHVAIRWVPALNVVVEDFPLRYFLWGLLISAAVLLLYYLVTRWALSNGRKLLELEREFSPLPPSDRPDPPRAA